MTGRLAGALKTLASITIVMTGIALLRYAYLMEHLTVR